MTDSCLICQTDAISLDDWYLKISESHNNLTVIECICPWCVKDMEVYKARYEEMKERYLNGTEKYFGEVCGLYFEDEPYPTKNKESE
jgi:hypothetical protein